MLAVCLYRLYTGLYVSGMVISPVHWFVCKRNGYIACTLICMGLCLLYSGLYVSGMVTSPVHWFLCKRNNGCYFADFHFQPETQRNLRLTIDALRGKRQRQFTDIRSCSINQHNYPRQRTRNRLLIPICFVVAADRKGINNGAESTINWTNRPL